MSIFRIRPGVIARYTENEAPLAIVQAFSITGTEMLWGATVTIASGYSPSLDVLDFTAANGITGHFDPATGVLTFSGHASAADYQSVLRSVTFEHLGDAPAASRTIAFQLEGESHELTRVVTGRLAIRPVADAPWLAVHDTVVFGTPQATVALDPALVLTDPDSEILGVTVRIDGYVKGQDILAFTPGAVQVRGSFDASSGVLELKGRASVADFEQVLRSITYTNTSGVLPTGTRTITIVAQDATRLASNVVTVDVVFAAAPEVTVAATPVLFTEGDGPVTLDAGLTVADLDDASLVGGSVRIASGFDAGDTLSFTNTANIAGSWDAASGVLTLAGTASLAEYQEFLRSVQFQGTSDAPTPDKTIEWVLGDGTHEGAPAVTHVQVAAVNDAPTLSSDAALAYTENAPAAAIAPNAVLADVDSPDFAGGSLTVRIESNRTGADVLAVANTGTAAGEIGVSGADVTYGGTRIGSFGIVGADLVVTFAGSAATREAVEALVRSITFHNTSDDPSALARTVSFTVVDGDGGASTAIATTVVSVSAVNDAPTVSVASGPVTFVEDGSPVTLDAALALADADDTQLTEATVSISSGLQAGDELLVTAGSLAAGYDAATGVLTLSGAASLATYQAALRSVQFRTLNDDPAATRTIDWSVTDGTDASAAGTTHVTVTPVNDASTLTVGPGIAYQENDAPTAIAPAATVADPDSSDFAGGSLTVRFTAGGLAEDSLGILDTGAGAGEIGLSGSDVTYGGTVIGTVSGGNSGGPLVIALSAAATAEAVQALVRAVTYANASDDPSAPTRTLSFDLLDGDGGTTSSTSTVAVTPVDDAPVFTAGGGTASFIEGGLATVVDAGLALADVDSPQLTHATVTIGAGFQSGDSLVFTDTAAIVGSYDDLTGVLTLTGAASVAQYQAALRTVKFESTNDAPNATRDVSWVVGNAGHDSAAVTTTIGIVAVNDAPVLDATAVLGYTENDAPQAISPGATLSDIDSTDFGGGSLTIHFSAGGTVTDQLGVLGVGSGPGEIGISGGEVRYEGVAIGTLSGGENGADLVVDFAGSAATPAAVQALVRSIAYHNTSDAPSTPTRTVSFTVTDGDGGAGSATSTATIAMTAVNDAPSLTASAGSASYTEGGAAVALDPSIAIADADSTQFASATVQVTDGFLTGHDVLAFSGTMASGNITAGAFDDATGTLTLTSAGGVATLAQWRAALQAVTFDTDSTSPGPSRTVSFTLDDGSAANATSTAVTRTIAITEVNSRPAVTIAASAVTFTENDAPLVVNAGIAVADDDSALLTGATVRVGAGFVAGDDWLAFTAVGEVTGDYDEASGVLTLSGSGTLDEYRQVLASVTYENTSENPGAGGRTIEFVVDDGQSVDNLSEVTARTITVQPVNDAPVLGTASTLAWQEGDAATALVTTVTLSDVDSADFAGGSLTVRFSAGGTADDQLSVLSTGSISVTGGTVSHDGTAIGTVTGGGNGANLVVSLNADADAAGVQALIAAVGFANSSESPSTGSREVTFELADGDGATGSSTATFDVSGVNDAPQLAGAATGTLAYTENDAATVVDPGFTITDVDGSSIAGATVVVGSYVAGEDVLAFTGTATITGSFDAGTGVLTLGGTDSIANYEAALRSVTYRNTSDDPSAATRTIGFQVDDGGLANAGSNIVSRDVAVSPVNDAPVIAGTGSATYVENAAAVNVGSGLTLSDVDGDALAGATVTISGGPAGTEDVLDFTAAGGITGSFDSASGTLTLSGPGTVAEYQAALQSVTFQATGDAPSTAVRTLTFETTDSLGATSDAATTTVAVTAVNDAPVTTVPDEMTLDTAFSHTGMAIAGISVSDVDAGATTVQATVTAGSGTLDFVLDGGATASGNHTGAVVLSGTVQQVNAALASLVYTSTDGFTGIDTIGVSTSDLGHTGDGGAQVSNASFRVGVVPQVFVVDNTDTTADTTMTSGTANAFNSLASFNSLAADGAGDYVYIRTGTGTYSASSTLTLQDNERVYGQGETLSFVNPVTGEVVTIGTANAGGKPVISVSGTSTHGIDLAQGNTLAGFNIATTLGGQTGVSDGNGTVGALNLSNMDITGAGMALDIDQGGSLNVSLGTLSSSASTQQGIQLGGGLTGTFTATNGAIAGSSGAGFQVGSGSASSGGTVAITYGGSITTTGAARAIDIQDRATGAGAITLSGAVSHTLGNATTVYIEDIAGGSITLSGGAKLDSGTTDAIVVNNVTASASTIAFTNSLDIDTTTGRGVAIAGNAGTVSFTGANVTVNTTSGTGVSMAASSGKVTFNDTGTGLDVVTTSGGAGIVASGGGQLAITGTGNSISATGATGLSVNGTTIGTGGLNFVSVGSTGGTNNILLNGTGANALNVAGTGSASTGGTLANASGDGISVTNGTINLNWMQVQNSAGNGINAVNLVGANTLANSTITGFDAGGVNAQDGFHVVNTNVAGTTTLAVTNATFSGGATGNDGLSVEAQGTSNLTLTVSGSTFTGLFGDGVQVNTGSTATGIVRATVQNSTFQNAVATNGNGGISFQPIGGSTFFADVNTNTFDGVMNAANTLGVINVASGGHTNADITLRNNIIKNIAGGGAGISVIADGGSTDLLLQSNAIDQLGGAPNKFGVYIAYGADTFGGTSATGNASLLGNNIGQNGNPLWTGGDGAASAVLVQTYGTATLNVALKNNVVDANTSFNVPVVRLQAIGTSTMNATAQSNNLEDKSGTLVSFDAVAGSSSDTGTMNLSVDGNLLNGGALQLREGTAVGAVLNVTQVSSAAVASANGNATVTTSGTPSFGMPPPTTAATPALPLLAADVGTGEGVQPLTLAELGDIALVAAAHWASLPLSGTQLQALASLSFGLADMEGALLGLSAGGVILLDRDAAGHGWFVDATPQDNAEFVAIGAGRYAATDGTGRVDLLTAVMHEIGHALGLGDLDGSSTVMDGVLEAGLRVLPDLHGAVTLVGAPQEAAGA